MNRDFLKSFNLESDVIKAIMDENGKDVEAAKKGVDDLKQQLASKDTEIEGLKEQISQRDKDIEDLKNTAADNEALKTQLGELQTKYNTDTEALEQRLKDQQTEFENSKATETFFADVEFSSQLAKDAAIAQFKAKNFKLVDGVFEGGKEWLEDLRKTSPDGFKVAEPAKNDPANPKPKFSDPNPQQNPPPKKLSLRELMIKKNENPDMQVKYDN